MTGLPPLVRRGTTAAGPYLTEITPEAAGWAYSGLRIVELTRGGKVELATGPDETIVLPLSGAATVDCDGQRFALHGRRDVFDRVSDFAYLPRDADALITSADGGRFALPSARASRRLAARYVAAADVPVELRGSGSASRQVNNFCAPAVFGADRLIAVEVLTPGGNWSSYPPHKHDEQTADESQLEEIYYFEVARRWPGLPAGVQLRPGPPDRRVRRDRHGRRGAHPVRVPRPVHGRARLRPVLPERDGRPGGTRLAVPRRPGARVGAGRLARDRDRPAAATDPAGRRPMNSPAGGGHMDTVRLTVAQALVRFLTRQYSERDGERQRLVPGCFGIFGHGNVAGVGQALLEEQLSGRGGLPYYLARNEQAMVHAATGFARMRNRLQALACTASIGPGSTNMVTGAALATINRIPVLLLPSDIFATRVASPVLQELEDPHSADISVNDASGRCPGSWTASGARSSCCPRCWPRCAC